MELQSGEEIPRLQQFQSDLFLLLRPHFLLFVSVLSNQIKLEREEMFSCLASKSKSLVCKNLYLFQTITTTNKTICPHQ